MLTRQYEYDVFDSGKDIINIHNDTNGNLLILNQGDVTEFRNFFETGMPVEEILTLLGYSEADWIMGLKGGNNLQEEDWRCSTEEDGLWDIEDE